MSLFYLAYAELEIRASQIFSMLFCVIKRTQPQICNASFASMGSDPSRLKRVMGVTGLSNLNADQCSYLEKIKEKKTMYVKSASVGQKVFPHKLLF